VIDPFNSRVQREKSSVKKYLTRPYADHCSGFIWSQCLIWSQSHLFTLFSCHMCFLRTRPIYFCLAFIGLSLALKTNHGAVGSPRPLAIGLEPILGQEAGQEEAQKVRQKFVIQTRIRRRGFFSFGRQLCSLRLDTSQLSQVRFSRDPTGLDSTIAHLYYAQRGRRKIVGQKNLRRRIFVEKLRIFVYGFARFSPNFSRIFTRFSAPTA
jgi:hypothetical protein